jgi:hypothetical protein
VRELTGFDSQHNQNLKVIEELPAVPHLGMEGSRSGLLSRPGSLNHLINSQPALFQQTGFFAPILNHRNPTATKSDTTGMLKPQSLISLKS